MRKSPLLASIVCSIVALPACSSAQSTRPIEEQIAIAVSALPDADRAEATVLGFRTPGKLEVIREGSNQYICLQVDSGGDRFQASCYHRGLEPFMARGRELAEALPFNERQEQRDAELEVGDLTIPDRATLISIFGVGDLDAVTGLPDTVQTLRVVYLPHATPESTGLPTDRAGGGPWLMMPNSPRAHLMIPGEKRPYR